MGKSFQVSFDSRGNEQSGQGSGLWLTSVAIEVMIQRQLIAIVQPRPIQTLLFVPGAKYGVQVPEL